MPYLFEVRAQRPLSERLLYVGMLLTANIHVDGFNLYYGSLAHSRYKWLNIATMCQILFPKLTIKRIRYFTAIVKPLDHDQGAPILIVFSVGATRPTRTVIQ